MDAPVTNPMVKLGVRPPRELLGSTSFLLKRLGWAIKDRAMEAYEAVGASPYHYSVLALLDEGACSAQATIADALGYDRSWLVGLLDELEEAGLIERRRDPADRRRHLVSLKPEGVTRLAELRAISRSVEEEFLAPLDPTEREQLHAILLKLASSHDPRYAPGNGHKTPHAAP
jgi:DNA-binding MarR family transcriptional regulator